MREHPKDSLLSPLEELYAANRVSAQEFSDIWNKLPSAPILNHVTQVPNEPQQGMFVVDPTIKAFCFYLGTEWICLRDNPLSHAIKIYGDKKINKVDTNGLFRFVIDPLLDNKNITMLGAFVGTTGAGPTTIQIINVTRGITVATTTITGGTNAAFNTTMDTAGSVDNPHNRVHVFDDIWINCTAVATGSKGLGAYVYFDYPEDT